MLDSCNIRGKSKLNLGLVLDLETLKLTFMNINVKKQKAMGTIEISNSFPLISDLTKHFYIWKKSNSCPDNWYNVALKTVVNYDKVILLSIKNHKIIHEYYEKDVKESAIQFSKRISIKQHDNDSIDKKYIKLIFDKKDITESITKDDIMLFYGNLNNFNIKLPKDSYVISNESISSNDVIVVNEPYKVFNLK